MIRLAMTSVVVFLISGMARAEDVFVKYRGTVHLDKFTCRDVGRSSLVNRVCYDGKEDYLLISLRGTYYHYCHIDSDTVSELLSANSIGQYYNEHIKGDNDHDCRNGGVPDDN